MPRFVILEHDYPHVHWDFMLESGDVLRTWRLAGPPETGGSIAAEALPDHRRIYLDYEGPVSGGRGQVRRWDGGNFRWLASGSEEGTRVSVVLEGRRVRGKVTLQKTASGQWWLTL
jgi:hypothetical protein